MLRMCWFAVVVLLLLKMATAQDSLSGSEVKTVGSAKTQPARKKSVSAYAQAPVLSERRSWLTDSLFVLQEQIERQRDSFNRVLQLKNNQFLQLQNELSRRREEIRNYNAELSDLRGDNLQSLHTNSILFIINVVVGILLVVSLGWMYWRKRSEPGLNPRGRWNNQPAGEPSFDHRLDRIQKLGSLRDRGLLTEEEFNLQKRQMLGE